jgi:hypothetical protein
MSRTIEAIIKHMVASDAKQETAPDRTAKFIARWPDRTANHFWLRSAEVASGICAFTAMPGSAPNEQTRSYLTNGANMESPRPAAKKLLPKRTN